MKCLAIFFGVSNINDTDTFVEDLGAGSLDIMEVIMATEELFNIDIDDSEVEHIKTVGEAIEFLERKILTK